jgi:hypothetical protein
MSEFFQCLVVIPSLERTSGSSFGFGRASYSGMRLVSDAQTADKVVERLLLQHSLQHTRSLSGIRQIRDPQISNCARQ